MIGNARRTILRFHRRVKPALLGLGLIVAGLSSTTAKAAQVFPIEVMGTPPYIETARLRLPAGQGSSAVNLKVRAHNVSYARKGKVRVNGGTWYRLWNDVPAIKVAEPDRSYGGFGGGFCTVTFTLGTPDVVFKDNDNTIEFEYSWKDEGHPTAGYRIVDLDILDNQNRSLLPPGETSFDDPRLWDAPLKDSEFLANHIAIGKEIWTSFKPGGPNCMDCHTETGRDLKYFNISNKTIIEQCKKSGFSELQGKQVASYIRTLDQEVVPQARPWNPPYQPGPGTDGRPVYEWAAGAGLDAVLKSDAEMLPYMFGSGTQAEITAATNIDGVMNLREMPIAVQFPDWIHWIPRTHPMDIWGKDWWQVAKNQTDADSHDEWNNPYKSYQYIKQRFADESLPLANQPELIDEVYKEFQRNVMWWIGDGHSGHPWTDLRGRNISQAKLRGFTAAEAKLNLSRWRLMKLWEMFHTYGAEDKAADILPTAEKYQWPAKGFSTFQIAAHFIGDDRATSAFSWESLEAGTYFSSIWYQLQMVLNSGMRDGEIVSPVDWAYNHYHINRLGERTGVYEPLRLTQNLIKCYQERNRAGSAIGDSTWTMREVSPWRLYSDAKGDESTYLELDSYGLGKALRLRILRSMLNQFVRRVNEYGPADWPRASTREVGKVNWARIEPMNYVPIEEPDKETNFKLFAQTGAGDAIEADAMWRLIPRLEKIGLERTPVQALADWCATVWPRGEWNQLVEDVYTPNVAPRIYSPASASPRTVSVAALDGTSLSVGAQDSNPRDSLTYAWSKIRGDATVTFSTPDQQTTTATFAVPGTYELMVTVSDGELESTSSVEVIVTEPERGEFVVGFMSHADEQEIAVSDVTTVSVYATDGSGIQRVTLFLDGPQVSMEDQEPYLWNLPNLSGGTHKLRALALNGDGERLSAVIDLIVVDESQINTAPVAQSQFVTGNKGEPIEITLVGTDNEDDLLRYTIVSPPSDGRLSGGLPDVTYTPSEDFSGRDSFRFKVSDRTMDSEPATVNITVLAGSNAAPIAEPQNLNVELNTPLDIRLRGSDAENDLLSYEVVSDPSHGELSGGPRDLTYTPRNGYTGPDSFTFKVNDGTADSSPATINIMIQGGGNSIPVIDSGPNASPASISLSQDTVLDVDARDSDGDTLSYGWTKFSGPGIVTFTSPNEPSTTARFSAIGVYELKVAISDGSFSVNETVRVTVKADDEIWVNIESHEDGKEYEKSDNLIVRVGAGGADIKRVSLYLGGEYHSAKTESPYTWELGNLPIGEYKLGAVAVDADDDDNKSRQDITIWLVEPNTPPTLSFEEPSADISNLAVGSSVKVIARANDSDGTVVRLELFLNNESIQTLGTGSYSFAPVILDTAGTHTFRLVATDNDGATKQAIRNVTVKDTGGENTGGEDSVDRDEKGCGCSSSDSSSASSWLVFALLSVIVLLKRRSKYC